MLKRERKVIDPQDIVAIADDEILLTIKEFADLFGRQPESVRDRCRRGWDAAEKIAGQWYVRLHKRTVKAAQNRVA